MNHEAATMSSSPILRRLSTSTSTSGDTKEDLINAYEAEEERIINVLSRKLEQLREEKINLENVLEAESESHVNRLNRELSLLRARQRSTEEGGGGGSSGGDAPPLPPAAQSSQNFLPGSTDPRFPSAETMLEAMRKENESLRNRVVDMEREFIRVTRLNEVYREELIEHRRRLGLSVDSLVGLPGSNDPFSQPLHRRRSTSNSPTASVFPLPSSHAPRPVLSGVPIPRPPSQLRRPNAPPQAAADDSSSATTPLTTSPSSSPSPFPFSPVLAHHHAASSYVSNATQVTTPSSTSLLSNPPAAYPLAQAGALAALSYPSVPPPSLSSSLGSPTASYSPTEVRSPRSSRPCARVAEVGSLRDLSRSRSRRGSLAEAHAGGSPSGGGGGVARASPNDPVGGARPPLPPPAPASHTVVAGVEPGSAGPPNPPPPGPPKTGPAPAAANGDVNGDANEHH